MICDILTTQVNDFMEAHKMRTKIDERQSDAKLSEQADAIFQHIVEVSQQTFPIGKIEEPIVDLEPDELKEFVEQKFKQYGLNYIMVGNFNNHGSTQIELPIKTSSPLQNIEEVKEILMKKVEGYISNLEYTCRKCKAMIYDKLRAYQDEEKRKKQRNPFK